MRIITEDGLPHFVAESTGPIAIYLDNDSIIELAKGSRSRRDRFLEALARGGTLLFSTANAVEVGGPQGASSGAVRTFLEGVGANWIPLEMDFSAVIERERTGHPEPAVSRGFMEAYFGQRAFEIESSGSGIIDLTADRFFSLGSVVDWAREGQARLRSRSKEIVSALKDMVLRLRTSYEENPRSLDNLLPPIAWDQRRPATFVHTHLLRTLVVEARAFQLTDNDGLDFCHTVVGCAYASIATLDKQWKRRVSALPEPNQAALVFYRPQVDELVGRFEQEVANLRGRDGAS